MRDAAINLWVKPEQRDSIDRAAKLLGKTPSDFRLEAACAKAKGVVFDQAIFNLDAGRFKQFNKLLDAPAGHNPGLARLLKVRAPWGTKVGKA